VVNPGEVAYKIGCKDIGQPESTKFGTEETLGRHTEEFVQGYYDGYSRILIGILSEQISTDSKKH
jgi:hypothetical protein